MRKRVQYAIANPRDLYGILLVRGRDGDEDKEKDQAFKNRGKDVKLVLKDKD